MNYYMARQRESDGCWDWTRMNDRVVLPTGACFDGACTHATKEEAERHEHERCWELIRTGERARLDTHFGYGCPAKGCEEKAFFEIRVPGWICPTIACEHHLDHPEEWYAPTQITSSS